MTHDSSKGIPADQYQALVENYNQLKALATTLFAINISVDKMLTDDEYKELVTSELSALENAQINQIVDNIARIEKGDLTPKTDNSDLDAEESNDEIDLDSNESKATFITAFIPGSSEFKPIFFGGFMVLLACVCLLLFPIGSESDTHVVNIPTQSKPVTVEQPATVTPSPTKTPNTDLNDSLVLPTSDPILDFRLHGSNTIGEKLAPALLEAYLKQLGVTEMQWQAGDVDVERTLQYIKGGKAYAIELHAHGSSTGFKGMSMGKADMSMSSRRVKLQEVDDLKAKLGDLSKIGSEHIIGLDGLAIIVNENNPIKQISSEMLARIFAGEIKNWKAVGGPNQAINLFARDSKSGTYDTFKNLVLKKFKRNLSPTAKRFESSSELTTLVSQDEAAIGFIGLNYVRHNKALAISEGEGTTPIFPTRFTIGTEDYALSRRLYFYTPTKAANQIKDFARFAISRSGQTVVEKTGLISQKIKVETVHPLRNAPDTYNQFAREGKRLSLNFHFDYAGKDLDNKGKRDLERLITFMEENPTRRLVLMGFSDSVGAKDKNRALSFRRAKAVEVELTSRGIAVMSVEGFGELLPIANNNTPEGRERNRRVEVWVI